ncbi:MAG TPA: pilus assembly protein TadG-related protein [Pyrinomonadaceae bacterium]|nr:pilus assembly protein TadG-related protein [Pyrinomonadaceae bacterium]
MRTRSRARVERKRERGNVLVYTVLSVLFLFFAVGLGVDLSHLYLEKTELQNAADAAALAGASALTLPNNQKIPTALNRALDTLNLNKYNFDNRTFTAVMDRATQKTLVAFAQDLDGPYVDYDTAVGAPANIRFIRVNTPLVPVSIFFAGPILGTTRNLDAKATAGMSIPGNVRFCPAPLAAVECDPADASCIFDSRLWGTCPGANPNGIQTYDDGTTCNPKKTFCKGCTYTLRWAGGNFNSPGNFGGLDCGGLLRDNLAAYGNCNCGPTSVGDTLSVDTKTGVNAGPVAGGLNVRFDIYGHGLKRSDWATIPPDTNIADGTSNGLNGSNEVYSGITYAQYKASNPFTAPQSGETGVANRRILVLPLSLNTTWTNGSSSIQVYGIGAFFMQARANDTSADIKAEFTGNDVSGITGSNPSGTVNSNIVTPVLYR